MLFTIGYSGLDIMQFIHSLKRNDIQVVCDVRSTPYSNYKPDFSRREFKTHLNDASIKYVFLGAELGARPKDRSCYINGQATYERIARSSLFLHGLERVRNGVERLNLALVCSERDPLECHRAILVCRHLPDLHSETYHVHTNGRIETHLQFEERLVDLRGTALPPLLRQPGDWERAVLAAYEMQGQAIAYRERYPETEQELL